MIAHEGNCVETSFPQNITEVFYRKQSVLFQLSNALIDGDGLVRKLDLPDQGLLWSIMASDSPE